MPVSSTPTALGLFSGWLGNTSLLRMANVSKYFSLSKSSGTFVGEQNGRNFPDTMFLTLKKNCPKLPTSGDGGILGPTILNSDGAFYKGLLPTPPFFLCPYLIAC